MTRKLSKLACPIPGTPITLLLIVATAAACGEGSQGGIPEDSSQPQAPPPLEEVAAVLELEATYAEGFSFLNGVRELSDGSVLAADPLAEVLLRIDLDSSTADTLGRVGPGPQEYEQPDQVFPLPGDSSLLVDFGKTQLTVINPDGTLGEGISMLLPREDGFPDILTPRFVDGRGYIYHQAGRSRTEGPPDSAAVVRFDRGSGAKDTVATVWLPERTQRRTERFGFLPRMLEPRDDWAVGPEGQVAVIRAKDFSVEWTFPDGTVAVGPPHSFETDQVTREDKETLMADMRNSSISMASAVSRTGGVQSMSMSRGSPNSGDGPGVDDFEWAETFPAFRNDRAIVSPRGEAWVERWGNVESDTRLEVFDREGIWQGSVFLPPRHQLIGFGQGPQGGEVAYVVRTDEFDLKWLERYGVMR